MARGKNKAVAERRKAALTEIGSIDALRLRVKNLEEELTAVKADRDEKLELKNQNIRDLNKKIEEGTSKEMDELKALNADLRQRLDIAVAHEKEILDKWEKLSTRYIEKYAKDMKIPRYEAMSALIGIINDEFYETGKSPIVLDADLIEKVDAGKMTQEQAKIMHRKRHR